MFYLNENQCFQNLNGSEEQEDKAKSMRPHLKMKTNTTVRVH